MTTSNTFAFNPITNELDMIPDPVKQAAEVLVQLNAAVAGINQTGNPSQIAGTTVGGQRFVILNDSGTIEHADSSNVDHASRLCGLTLTSGNSGDVVPVQRFGLVTDSGWSWDTSKPAIFIGTNGTLTQTPPNNGFVCRVGYCAGPTKIYLDLLPPIILAP